MDLRTQENFISFFPSQVTLDYWKNRLQSALETGSGLLAKLLPIVLLNNEYQMHEQFSKSEELLASFKDLVGQEAMNKLLRAVYAKDVAARSSGFQEYQNELVKQRFSGLTMDATEEEIEERSGFESSSLFVTTLYAVGKGNLALVRDPASSWEWMSWSKLAHWLAGQYLRSQLTVDTRLANCMRITMARFMFNCAMRKDIFEYQFLVKSFQYFEGMVERKVDNKKLIRRTDSEIISSLESITAVLNMASCFLELRQTNKCRTLIKQARKLLEKCSSSGSLDYLMAYADYVEGLSHFEDTSPLKGKLNKRRLHWNTLEFNKKYDDSLQLLKKSAAALKKRNPDAPLTASVATMLAIVFLNKSVSLTQEAFDHLETALDLEMKHETQTLTAKYLRPILMEIDFEPETPERAAIYNRLCNKAEALFSVESISRRNNDQKVAVCDGLADSHSLDSSSSSYSLLPRFVQRSEHSIPGDIFLAIANSKQFLDAHRQESLSHFKKLLSLCSVDSGLRTRILCLLFISRHHLHSQYLKKVQSKLDQVVRLMDTIFGIRLDIASQQDFATQLQSHPVIWRELKFLVIFWLVNKAQLALGDAALQDQREAASRVEKMIDLPRDRNLKSFSQVVVFFRQKIADYRSKSKRMWGKARKILESAKRMLQEMKPGIKETEKIAFSFLSQFMAEAFYELNDLKAFDERYRSDPQLVFAVVDLLNDADELRPKETSTDEVTSADLLLHLDSAAINRPALSRYMKRLSVDKVGNRVLGKFQDLEVILTVSNAPEKIKQLQESYETCFRSSLFESEVHALLHFNAGLQLMRQAYMNPFKAHYNCFNAAILKFRKAARIFEVLYGDDTRTSRCYALMSLLYCHQVQLEDQESRCLSCLERCANIETRLVAKEANPSPWVWKCLEVIRDGKAYFAQLAKSEGTETGFRGESDKWTHLFDRVQAILKRDVPYCSMEPDSNLHHESLQLLADQLFDPLEEWEEKRNRSLKSIAVMMQDREFPKDSPPSDTEIRCYAQYLTKLFNRHWHFCPVPQGRKPEDRCQLDNLDGTPDAVIRNHFLEGLSAYTTSHADDKSRILKRLQLNHNLLLTKCHQAILYHENYKVSY